MKRIVVVCITLLVCFGAYAQNRYIFKGSVKASTGQSISDVQVILPHIKQQFVTNEHGDFEVTLPKGKHTIIFYHFSFVAQEHIVFLDRDELNMEVYLNPNVIATDTINIKQRKKLSPNEIDINTKNLDQYINPTGDGLAFIKMEAAVSSNNELSSAYSVRGGNFDENMIYVNGIQIFRPFLLRSGEQEGLSFVNSDLIESITFSAGGFDAQYGDKMSSVLSIQYKEAQEFKHSTNISLLGASVHSEGKIGKFSYIGGFRYRSNAYLLGALETQAEFQPVFRDFQSYITYRPNSKLKIAWLNNTSTNTFEMVPISRRTNFGGLSQAFQLNIFFDGKESTGFNTFFNAISLNYQLSEKVLIDFSGSHFYTLEYENFDIFGAYRLSEIETNPAATNFGESVNLLGSGSFLNHARNNLEANILNINHNGKYFGNQQQILWGTSIQNEVIYDDLSEWKYKDSASFSMPYTAQKINLYDVHKASSYLNTLRYLAYVQNNLNLFKNDTHRDLVINAGVRGQWWTFNEELLISPRISLAYQPAKKDTINGKQLSCITYRVAWGHYYQSPLYRDLRNKQGNIQEGLLAQKSLHYVGGMDYNFKLYNRPFTLKNEVYYKSLSNLIPYDVENVRIRYFGENSGSGYATGLESRVSGEFIRGLQSWMSISLMQTQEKINNNFYQEYFNEAGELIRSGFTQDTKIYDSISIPIGFVPRPTNQLYNIKLFFQDHMPKKPELKIHISLSYAAGLPFGPPNNSRYRNQLKMPPYRRVDVGFSWYIIENNRIKKNNQWEIPSNKMFSKINDLWIRFEVLNLLNINNTVSYIWVEDVFNRQYAVPNFLTQRLINLRLAMKF